MTYESKVDGRVGGNQAVNGDYKNTGYNKGHLYPHCHNCNRAQAESTFTLTNAAPQKLKDNVQWYHQVEKKVAQFVETSCSEKSAHVVTGVVPGNNYMQTWLFCSEKDVVVPSHFWTAVCCRDKYNQNRLVSRGYVLKMTGDGSANAVYLLLSQLNSNLANLYNYNTFKVFGQIQGCS